MAPFTTEDINACGWEFDVNKGEVYRTHWAIKDVDPFAALKVAGLGGFAVVSSSTP